MSNYFITLTGYAILSITKGMLLNSAIYDTVSLSIFLPNGNWGDSAITVISSTVTLPNAILKYNHPRLVLMILPFTIVAVDNTGLIFSSAAF